MLDHQRSDQIEQHCLAAQPMVNVLMQGKAPVLFAAVFKFGIDILHYFGQNDVFPPIIPSRK